MGICSECGKYTKRVYPGNTCQGCYNYFRLGGTLNPLPPKGVVARDGRGYVICHICGRAYVRLGSHLKESHGMTIAEYKEAFELCASARTTHPGYSEHMRSLAYVHNMDEQLRRTGVSTRFKRGDRIRKGVPVRLQERIMLAERLTKKRKG